MSKTLVVCLTDITGPAGGYSSRQASADYCISNFLSRHVKFRQLNPNKGFNWCDSSYLISTV